MYHVEYNPDEITAGDIATENALKHLISRNLMWTDWPSEPTEYDWDYDFIKVFVGGAKFSADENGKPVAELEDGAFKVVNASYVEEEERPGKNVFRVWFSNDEVTRDFKINKCDIVFYCFEGDGNEESHPRRVGSFDCDFCIRPELTDGLQEIEFNFCIDKNSLDMVGHYFYDVYNQTKSSHKITEKA